MGDRRVAHYSSGPRQGQENIGGGGGGGRGFRNDNKRKRDDAQDDDGLRSLCYDLFYLGDRKQVIRKLSCCAVMHDHDTDRNLSQAATTSWHSSICAFTSASASR